MKMLLSSTVIQDVFYENQLENVILKSKNFCNEEAKGITQNNLFLEKAVNAMLKLMERPQSYQIRYLKARTALPVPVKVTN